MTGRTNVIVATGGNSSCQVEDGIVADETKVMIVFRDGWGWGFGGFVNGDALSVIVILIASIGGIDIIGIGGTTFSSATIVIHASSSSSTSSIAISIASILIVVVIIGLL